VLWIPFTLFAAFMQAWRNAFQSKLSKEVGSAGVTLARFIYAAPLAALYLHFLFSYGELPYPPLAGSILGYIFGASVAQIFATVLMVKLFQLRNFAVGVGLAKSEALLAATLGAIFFAAPLSLMAWIGVLLGAMAVWMLSTNGKIRTISLQTATLGLGSGLCFALTTLWVREASLLLGLPFPYSAAYVLFWVICLQTLILIVWLLLRSPATLQALWFRPKLTILVSVTSFLGSVGWFSAMSLETVALVKTLGQVEVLFTLAISTYWFKDKLAKYDLLGLFFIVAGATLVVLA
jgi:drug/metabolite transporter (DMT)-like permease